MPRAYPPVVEQEIRFTAATGSRVAWATCRFAHAAHARRRGMVVQPPRARLAERLAFRAFAEGLATRFRVVRYDRPGTGLSDRDVPPPPDLRRGDRGPRRRRASGDGRHLGTQRATASCSSGSRPVAASRSGMRRPTPNASVGSPSTAATPTDTDLAPEAARRSLTSVVAAHWGLGSRVLADLFLPARRPRRTRRVRPVPAAQCQRRGGRGLAGLGVRHGRARRPARGDDADAGGPSPGRPHAFLRRSADEVAARVPGATFVSLDGVDHLPWRGDAASVARAVSAFLADGAARRTGTPSAGRPGVVVRARGGGPASRRSRHSPTTRSRVACSSARTPCTATSRTSARSSVSPPGRPPRQPRPAAVSSDRGPSGPSAGMAGPRDARVGRRRVNWEA